MKQLSLFTSLCAILLISASCSAVNSQIFPSPKENHLTQIIYFNPEIFPDIEEIKEPTYLAFFSAVSDQFSNSRVNKLLRVDYNIEFDNASPELIAEFCLNNNAQYAVVPKVKYFKVGFGKYVFSNQVIISLKIFDAKGTMLTETSYDTYRKKGRLLGSAENSIKIGTTGAFENLSKLLRRKNRSSMNACTDKIVLPVSKFTLN